MPETDPLRAWLAKTRATVESGETACCPRCHVQSVRIEVVADEPFYGPLKRTVRVPLIDDPQTVTLLVDVAEAAERDAEDRVSRGEWVPGPLLSALAALRAHVERAE